MALKVPNGFFSLVVVVTGCGVGDGRGVSDLGHGSGVDYGGGVHDGGSSIAHGSSGVSHGGSDFGDVGKGFPVNDSVKTVVVISGVLNGALCAIGVDDRVRSFHNVTITSFVLGLGVAGVSVLNIVRESVLGVGVFFDGDLGDGGGVAHGGRVVDRSGVVDRGSLYGVAGVGEGS